MRFARRRLRRLGGWLVLSLLTGGCHVVWYGYDPARSTPVNILSRCGEQFVEVGAEEHASFDAVAMETLAVSEQGRVAYAALDGGSWFIVVDGHTVGPAFARIGYVGWASAPDTLLAVVGGGTAYRVLSLKVTTDRRVSASLGPTFDAIAAGSIVTTRDGGQAYVGWHGRAAHVVVGSDIGPAFDGVAHLVLHGGLPSYVARRGDEAWVVRNGELDGPYEDVAELVTNESGTRIVALVRKDGAWYAQDGLWTSRAYDRIGDVTLSPRTSKLAFRAGRGDDELVVLEGRELGPYPAVTPKSLAVGGPNDHVVFSIHDGNGSHVVVDGVASEPWSSIEEVTIGADGRVGFIAETDQGYVVIIDGKQRSAWSWAGDLRLSRTGRDAFIAHRDGHDVVVDGKGEHPFAQLIRGTLQFASNGSTWGVVGVEEDRLVLASAKGTEALLDVEEIAGEILRRRDSGAFGAVLDGLVAAELEKASKR